MSSLIEKMGSNMFEQALEELNNYAERLAFDSLSNIPDGEYEFSDVMDDDGMGNTDIVIKLKITVAGHRIICDFIGTNEQVRGNINCPLSVAAAAVYYVFRCLMPEYTPACAGSFRSIQIEAPIGCMLNARRPAAVAAGNVETSTRVVDVVMGALSKAIPEKMAAASQGSMNNIAMGARTDKRSWNYYETIGGGMGASRNGHGLSAVQTHMTNTLNTPIESLEIHYPIRVARYEIRKKSGGAGLFHGGDGLLREFEFLDDTQLTLLTERRTHSAWGLNGGQDGLAGENLLNDQKLPPKITVHVNKGDKLCIKSPGGGGFGKKIG